MKIQVSISVCAKQDNSSVILEIKSGKYFMVPNLLVPKEDIAYSPIGIPLIAGPGAITSVMILSEKVNTIHDKIIFILAIAICMILTYMILIFHQKD